MQGDLSFAKRKASARDGVVADAAVLFVRFCLCGFFVLYVKDIFISPFLGWDSLFIVITFYSFSESALGLRAQVGFLNTEEI